MSARHDHEETDMHDHDRGLAFDVTTLLSRRGALAFLGGAGLASMAACRSGSNAGSAASISTAASSTAASSAAATSAAATSAAATSASSATVAAPDTTSVDTTSVDAATAQIPEETAGPFPGDGSNGVNVLTESGIVRQDITTSYGTGSATAAGVPLTLKLKVLDLKNGAAPLVGAAVYLWHCDMDGRYSLYSEGVTEENYLRGVQQTDADGLVTFTSIYPAAYPGRWPHAHFEVYPSLAAAAKATDKLRTSQLALPEETSSLVYATKGYENSIQNLAQTSLARDMVFSDGYSLQLATMTGTVATGLTAALNVPV